MGNGFPRLGTALLSLKGIAVQHTIILISQNFDVPAQSRFPCRPGIIIKGIMKILMLCEFYQPSTEMQEVHLVREYRALGHEVTVVTSTFENIFDFYQGNYNKRSPESIDNHLGATIIRLKYRWHLSHHIRAHRSISNILREERPDLIYVHDIMLNILECSNYVKRNPNCRMIMDYHADYTNSGRNRVSLKILHGVWRKWFLNRARPTLSKIFPIVPNGALFLNEVYGVTDSEMELLPLGADITGVEIRKSAINPAELRRELGLSTDSFLIFTGGKLDPQKRTEVLIRAVRLLGDLNIEVIVVGDSQVPGRYEQLINESGSLYGNAIKFLGWQSTKQIEDLLIISDLAVFPASQSILWQKAVSVGLPLVVGDSGNQNPSYMNWGNIIVSTAFAHDPISLSYTIRKVAEDPEFRHQMHLNALRVGSQVLDWKLLIQRTLRFNES
jgi:1,2-diacylglycerol 3-alpha-glucosyltransferase